ncbi:MAG TPA: peptidylprolyl isomerase [Dehalococcoidia bacterium]|nr:peptidylprolyl isomerase [Dehalococcoidia bacterium]
MSRRYRALSSRSYPWSEMDPDRRNAVLLTAGIALVVVFAVALISYGYYKDRIAPNHETVLSLGSHKYDYSFLKRRVSAEVKDGKVDLSKENAVPTVLGGIEQEAVLREVAKRDGLTISDAEVMAKIAEKLGLPAKSTRNEIAPVLRIRLLRLGLSLSEYEDVVRAEVASVKIKDAIEASIPTQAEQVNVRLIQTSSQTAALQAKQRIEAGESFAVVAAALSQDEASKSTGGDVGLVPRGALPAEVEKVAFEIIGLSNVIETKNSFFLIQVLEKKTDIVGSNARELYTGTTLSRKMEEAREALGGSQPKLTNGQVQKIVRSLTVSGA